MSRQQQTPPLPPTSGKTVLVTVGATHPFPQLTIASITPLVQTTLQHHGYTRIILQHGLPSTSTDPTITTLLATLSTKPSPPHSLEIIPFSLAPNLLNHISESDLVISHAGSGTILDVLRLGKRLIVVPNPALMDGHQKELAREMEKQGYLVEGGAGEKELAEAITKSVEGWPKHFPRKAGGGFQAVVNEEMLLELDGN